LLLFDFGQAFSVVVVQKQKQAPPVHLGTLAEGQALANKAAQPLTQRIVEAFHMVGLPAVFAHSTMVPFRDHVCIRLPKVGIHSLVTVARREALPKPTARGPASVTNCYGNYLTGAAAQSEPNPRLVVFVPHKRPEFIEFQHVPFLGGGQSLG